MILTGFSAIFLVSFSSLGFGLLFLIDHVGLEGLNGSPMQTLSTINEVCPPFHRYGEVKDMSF